ncbi:SDR family NAD(P)-dependent oxidoreductase [Nocardia jiangsuensis]|uniref:SDR family NAD(P)-dependent oxidoreductase n=1 Tax=Nocardia jiangsuensis TaxID=1691563 RepID=A0ABV8E0B7_9NOCA
MKAVVVAGGASGIGAATARRLGAAGHRVLVGDFDAEGARRTAAEVTGAGRTALPHAFDLAEEDSVRELIAAAVGEFGGLDGLFNVGADMRALRGDTDVVDIDLAVWDRLLTVNLRGYLLTMRHAIPHLLERGGGAIVNTSSAAAFQGEPARPAYAAAKAGIGALTRHVATRWGRDGIRCNAVAPGFTATEAIRAADRWPELEAGALRRMHSPRVGESTDVAGLVTFLLSDDGAWINGQVLNIDGGTVLR